jgi:uncharacterized protein (DUF4213/DUF364 family)
LASTVKGTCFDDEHAVADAGELLTKSAYELASLLRSSRPVEASIGMAALNALLAMGSKRHREINARELILEEGAGKHVAVVGHFPFVEDVVRVASRCSVLELQPRPGDLPAEDAAMVLPDAEVVAITSTSIVNHTFDELIRLCRPETFIVLLGGSTPLSPVLFDLNVDVAAGVFVRDIEAVVASVSQGATFRQIRGKQLVALAATQFGRLASRPQEE